MLKRVVKKTMKNDTSSWSHLVFQISVHDEVTSKKGNLVLVDLAGSEWLSQTQTEGETFKESLAINKSLLSLGEVMNALFNNS